MGQISGFTPWKLVIGIICAEEQLPGSLPGHLEAQFGAIDYRSPVLPFDFTDYYRPEMGFPLFRFFLSFRCLLAPERLAEIKIAANAIEEEYRRPEGGRLVNLDPGLLNASRFVLATTKDNSHRIPLEKGIYAELTLQFAKKDFQVLPWTYPDYATREYRGILRQIREIFYQTLKHGDGFRCNN